MQIKTEEELKVLRYANQVASTSACRGDDCPNLLKFVPRLFLELQGMSTSYEHVIGR